MQGIVLLSRSCTSEISQRLYHIEENLEILCEPAVTSHCLVDTSDIYGQRFAVRNSVVSKTSSVRAVGNTLSHHSMTLAFLPKGPGDDLEIA